VDPNIINIEDGLFGLTVVDEAAEQPVLDVDDVRVHRGSSRQSAADAGTMV